MGLAFEMTRLALGLADRGDPTNEVIAKRIIELAKTGELNPDVLCECVVKEFVSTVVHRAREPLAHVIPKWSPHLNTLHPLGLLRS
jgi:hypothetical protein